MSGMNFGKAAAVIGVIGSMFFVGLEIRQSNAQARAHARASAYLALGIATAQAFDTWAHDPNLLPARYADPTALDSTDWQQWALKFTGVARLGETVLLQIEQGILPPEAMDQLGFGGWKRIHESPKHGCVWPLIRQGAGESFRTFVEEGQDPDAVDCSQYALPSSLGREQPGAER